MSHPIYAKVSNKRKVIMSDKDLLNHPFAPLIPEEQVLQEFHEFNRSHSSVVLGTVNKDGNADTSYAPVLQKEDHFYIYISELAVHTPNLLNHLNLSLMFIEPEDKARNLFKRKRSTIRARAETIARDSDKFNEIMKDYAQTFGKIMRNLSVSKDFHLFKLIPEKATFVRGFGQAYKISGEKLDKIAHMGDRGHGKAKLNDDGTAKQKVG